jgi:hypothetical protein
MCKNTAKMGSQKRKAQKLKERKERIRLQKHERRSQPQAFFSADEEDLSRAGAERFAASRAPTCTS